MTLQDAHCRLMQLESCESHDMQSVRKLLSIRKSVKQTSRQVFPPLSPGRLLLGHQSCKGEMTLKLGQNKSHPVDETLMSGDG